MSYYQNWKPSNIPLVTMVVTLWHQYLNTADEYSHKQVAVAVRLMELLSKVKP